LHKNYILYIYKNILFKAFCSLITGKIHVKLFSTLLILSLLKYYTKRHIPRASIVATERFQGIVVTKRQGVIEESHQRVSNRTMKLPFLIAREKCLLHLFYLSFRT
jgi:hypothetical protein